MKSSMTQASQRDGYPISEILPIRRGGRDRLSRFLCHGTGYDL
ncbi:hypothetical protein U3A58_05815 [Algoriphagus sp. C2-6-M1]|nr:hypothetical protein [Algoriphagus sp. C2-6-M1]MEB2779905.1 hypothetical protein [Algoriphagus sp. C2-6-M1]